MEYQDPFEHEIYRSQMRYLKLVAFMAIFTTVVSILALTGQIDAVIETLADITIWIKEL